MITPPAWARELTDGHLLATFGAATMVRGRQYAAMNRVTNTRVEEGSVRATVRGNAMRTYETAVWPDPRRTVDSSCSCPVGQRCKHAVALLVTLRSRGAESDWRRSLARFTSTAVDGSVPLALAVEQTVEGYTLRPMRPGNREAWIRSGATWDDVRLSTAVFNPDHRTPLVALLDSRRGDAYGYAIGAGHFQLDRMKAEGWRHLTEAVRAGVQLVSGNDLSGRPLPPAELAAEPIVASILVEDADGGARVAPVLEHEGERFPPPARSLQGYPAHGVVLRTTDQLLLSPLKVALGEAEHALFGAGEVLVPKADLNVFAAAFLPGLRRRLGVEVSPGIELPEVRPAQALCRVEFGDRTASVNWGYRYRIGSTVHDVGLRPSPTDPPVRQPADEARLAASLQAGPWGPTLSHVLLTGRQLIEFVDDLLPALAERDDVAVEVTGTAPEFREADEAPQVSLTVTDSTAGDWFDLGVTVTVDGEKVPFLPLFTALNAGDEFLLLDSGTWFPLDAPELAQLRVLIEEARAMVEEQADGTFRLRPEHAGLWEELVALGVVAEQSAAWQRSVSALLDLDELPEVAPPAGLKAELRPYQQTGFEWLAFLWNARLGGILADEMGLGKTMQALALAQAAHEAGELDAPLLVVAPTTVIGTWQAEAAKFTPDLTVVAITETKARRGDDLAHAVDGAHIVLTSYTLLRLEAEAYRELTWSTVLLDEAQFVKNHASKAYQAVRKLRARHKIALTGTPLENNLMDLWSLLSITAPGLFPDPKGFAEAFRKPIEGGDKEALARLHRRIRPLILRRTKSAVATELPEKQEQLVPVELAPQHRRLYDRHLARERQKVLGLVADLNQHRITILRSLTMLRQLSLSPALVDPGYPVVSAKIDALVDMLAETIAEGHRALVFSQFTGFLALVKQRLDAEHIGYQYLDGRTRDRARRIAAFREGDDPVFLISLKAGGFGLTLTEADYVFILDPWWNPAAEAQAIDRTHRIGQDKHVNVYRLVAADTIEEKVMQLQESKRNLFDAVVGSAADVAAPLTADDIRGLLD